MFDTTPTASSEALVNRVANSGLTTIDLETYYPTEDLVSFDLKDYLFMELVLKEKDFRAALAAYDWTACEGKRVAVWCSADAIVPTWAYMLVAIHAAPFAAGVSFGTPASVVETHYTETLAQLDLAPYIGARVVIKGCSAKPVPISAYVQLARLLTPIAKTIMYGEPCSTVPLYKKK